VSDRGSHPASNQPATAAASGAQTAVATGLATGTFIYETNLSGSQPPNHDRNTTFVRRYFDDDEFQQAVRQIARKRAYDLLLGPARDEALRRLRASATLS
jgi:hypothetical protein